MKNYESRDLRNVALLGHGGSGKTILAEAMAYKTKLIDRMGKVEEHSTISDYDPEEHARTISITTSLIPLEYNKHKINILDTPGYFDFVGEQLEALRVADSALLVIDAMSGVEVGTEKAWAQIEQRNIPCMIIANKLDRENVDFGKLVDGLQDYFGMKAIPFFIPTNEGVGFDTLCDIVTGKGYQYENGATKEIGDCEAHMSRLEELKESLIETAASANEELMEKYLEGEELSAAELNEGIKEAIAAGELIPIIPISASHLVGIDKVMDFIINVLPSPVDSPTKEVTPQEESSVFVFKTIADPYVGKLSVFKVMSGTVTPGMEMINSDNEHKEKINHVYTLIGKKQDEIEKLNTGDLGAFSKLTETVTNHELRISHDEAKYDKIHFPKPNFSRTISPKSKGDEDKLGTGLARIKEEDQTVTIERNAETNQTIISGMGEMHLDVVAHKLKNKFGIEVEMEEPLIPYRETIKKKAVAEGKHKKQSGGSGQYGVVSIEFEPTHNLDESLEFVDKVVGGSVPRQFIPAVEKGLHKAIEKGVLAGYPLVGLRATLFDGKYHPVDSDEMSFVTAASLAYREGVPNASPVLLEPIYHYSITVPEEYMGDIMGDLNKKRGRIMGMEPVSDGNECIDAEVPLGEMFRYATELRSMTHGRGDFDMEFAHYEEVPSAFSEKIIADAKAKKEAAK